MKNGQYENVDQMIHHIDNGGISVKYGYYDFNDCKVPSIKISTQYHGYTNVSSELSGHELSSEVLREIGEKFLRFADFMEKNK